MQEEKKKKTPAVLPRYEPSQLQEQLIWSTGVVAPIFQWVTKSCRTGFKAH